MSVGTPEILVILLVALLVFGPHRLPEVGRQVGAAMREMRRIQDTVRGELDMVLHPEHGTSSSDVPNEPGGHSDWSDDVSPVDAESTQVTSTDVTSTDLNATDFDFRDNHHEGDSISEEDSRFLGPPDSFI
jgi:TatA/E family protein of Tat protein translocase